MLIYAMTMSADGYVVDRGGGIDWAVPNDELIRFHGERVGALGGYLLGRRLYEAMLGWETDPSMRDTPDGAAFADIWTALPKVVFSRTLDRVEGNARLASAPLADEIAAMAATGGDIEIGGADLAAQAVALDLVDELRMFRAPILLGGGTPYVPPVAEPLPLDLIETRAFGSIVYERYRRTRPTD
jgi:dihydrofolate reductase